MTSQEIFEKLMEYRNDSVRGDDELDEYFDAIMYSVAKVLGLSDSEAHQLAGEDDENNEVAEIAEQIAESVELNPSDYEISDGYIGSMGMTYQTATAETLAKAVSGAAAISNTSENEMRAWLLSDLHAAKWCKSPNYTYDHSYGMVRRKRNVQPVKLVKCSCGHSVPQSQVMSASMGTSCPDCYDRMSN